MSALGAASLLRCRTGASVGAESPAFPLGVASGDVTASSALLWTRYAGSAGVELRVWREGTGGREVVHRAAALPDGAGFIHAEVAALAPGTRYQYSFQERSGVPSESRVGRFRTALAEDDLSPLVIGATSCMRFGYPMDTLERAAERSDLDLFLLLGDSAYVDGARTLEEYRDEWARSLATDGNRALRAAHSVLATWDDHEFENNWAGATIHPLRFEAAARAFFEVQPVRRDPLHPSRLWRSVRWGRTAELFVLDGRGERDPDRGLYVSTEQLAWVKRGLAESPAVFKILLNSVPISEFSGALWASFAGDRWEGYPAQRLELLRHIEEQGIGGVLWVSGDFHLASMGRVSRSGPGARAIEVLVGPGANAPNPAPSYPGPPQFDWSSGVNNYATIALRPETREVELTYRDGRDRVLAQRTYTL